MIIYSLSEAVAELEEAGYDGVRIHRSHWISHAHLERVESVGRKYTAHLSNDLSLPVGPTYIGLLKASEAVVLNR
jgi:pyruvate formate-lyase activating enzyme-like uncharacterized protein